MKKRFLTGLIMLTLALCLLISVFSMAVSASDDKHAYEWILSECGDEIIRDDGRVYTLLSIGNNFYLDPYSEYAYANEVSLGEIYSYAPDGEIIWVVDDNYDTYIYTTINGLSMAYEFFEGNYASYRIELEGTYKSSVIDNSVIESMNALGVTELADVTEVDVTVLANYTCHDIIARDNNNIFSRTIGLVFETESGYYYVNYAMLDNSNFDAQGYFSFRSGSVPIVKLSGIEEATLAGAIRDAESVIAEYEYEVDRASAENAFWVMFVIVGFIAPIPIFIMGFYLANSAKRGAPKYWYSLSILAAAWFVLSIVLMLLLM